MALMKTRRFVSCFGVVSFFMFCSYVYLTPYLSILGFKSAIERKDYEGARKYIHFNSVRRSLKSQLLPALQQRTEREISESSFGELKLLLVKPVLKVVVDTTVDSTVTPYGLKLLLETGRLTQRIGSDEDRTSHKKSKSSKAVKVRLFYENFNVFVLSTLTAGNKGTINSYWGRESFFNWKLNAIELPTETILSVSK